MQFDPSNNCPYASGTTAFGDVVLSSRARLARNLEGFPFVNSASAGDCEEVESLLSPACHERDEVSLEWVDLHAISEIERTMCAERHLISTNFASAKHPRGVMVGPELARSVMINEEDHLRIQSIQPGLNLLQAHQDVKLIDHRMEDLVAYAFDDRLGFLTACPTNVGTGARFSVMMHLPALRITKAFRQLHNACEGMSIAIRGYHGEGSKTIADLYQLSNQVTLGYNEDDLRKLLEDEFLPTVIETEREARMTIVQQHASKLDDRVFRAKGILETARLLPLDEAMDCLSRIRLGVCLERITDIEINTINQLFIEIQKGHLEWRFGNGLSDAALQQHRADLVKEKLAA
jgi:protein arginine kinase